VIYTSIRVSHLRFLLVCFLATSWVRADDNLVASRALWRAVGVVDYEYRYEKVCDCHRDIPAATIVTVADGRVVAVRYSRDDYIDDMPVAEKEYRWFRTIDDLFSLIETATAHATTLRVVYDPTRGYPSYIYVDYDHSMLGDEVEIEVTSLSISN
jgi:hypothetical protein